MHFSKVLACIAAAFAQGGLAASVLVYAGRDCTGASQDIHIIDNTCANSAHPYLSYKENGFGSHGQRLAFNNKKCDSNGDFEDALYTTWAYDGDYFHSKTCYNLADHTQNGKTTGNSIRSYIG